MITIGIVDDHQVLADALALIIGGQPDMRVAGVAGTCAAARELVPQACPDVLLLDVALADGDGLSLVPDVARMCPDTSILVLTSLYDRKTLSRAIDAGVSGFVSKDRPLSEVITAIRQAAEGEIVMPASLLLGLVARSPHARGERDERSEYLAQYGREPLTPREREILALLARGRSGAAIAAELNIAHQTVRTHVRNLMEKLGVHSRLEAVAYALRHGLIEPPV
jgi:DNA-binding NarL/FixJ family response regulator